MIIYTIVGLFLFVFPYLIPSTQAPKNPLKSRVLGMFFINFFYNIVRALTSL